MYLSQMIGCKPDPSTKSYSSTRRGLVFSLMFQFLDRLQMFSDESQKRRQELTAKTRKEIEERTEKQLAVQYRLSLPTANRRTALKGKLQKIYVREG